MAAGGNRPTAIRLVVSVFVDLSSAPKKGHEEAPEVPTGRYLDRRGAPARCELGGDQRHSCALREASAPKPGPGGAPNLSARTQSDLSIKQPDTHKAKDVMA